MAAAEKVVADEVEDKPEPTLREQLESARDEVVARQEKEHGDGSERVLEAGAASGDPEKGRDGVSDRARGADGKFTRQADTGASERVAPASTEVRQPEAGPGGSGATASSSVQPVALPAPTSWKAEEKALWPKVPPDVQHVLHRREQDMHRAITAQDEARSVGQNFMQAANEFAPVIQARGGNPVALFREVLGIISQIHNTDPANRAQLFRQLAAQNGADLRQLGIPQQPGAPSGQQPNVPIDQLVRQQVNEQFQARLRQEQQQREQAETETTNREIETFRSKVDANGQPAYPYFDHVTSLMASILGGGAATTLEEAYQLAVKAHPETSQLIAQAAEAAARAKEEARRKAENARRKAGSVRGGVGSTPNIAAGDRTIRDELKAAFEEARGRV